MEKKEMNIYQKLLEVKKQVPYLQKDREGHQYTYATPSQVLGTLNPILNSLGLILKTEVIHSSQERVFLKPKMVDLWVGKEKTQEKVDVYETMYHLTMRMTWIDTETGEKDENLWASSGVNGDEKGFGSALTYAERYFLLKYFNIPTDNDDPDSFQSKHMTQAEIDRIEKERALKFQEAVRQAVVAVKGTKSLDELKGLKDVYSKEIRNTPDYQGAAVAQAKSFETPTEPEAPKTEENTEGLKKKKAEKPAKAKVEEPVAEKPADTFIEEMNNMKEAVKPMNEGTVGLFDAEGNIDPEFTPEEVEEAEVVEQIDALQEAITKGQSFTDPTAMVAWWKEQQDNLSLSMSEEEFAALKKAFSVHYEKIKS